MIHDSGARGTDLLTGSTEAQERATAPEWRLRQAETETKEQYNAWLVSDQQVGHLGRQVGALEARVQDLTVRRDALEARLLETQRQADAERAAAASERDTAQAHLRQVEDRAYGEVDRLRQDAKVLKAQLTTQAREHAAALRASERTRRDAELACQRAQREAATWQGRSEALAAKAAAPKRTAKAAAAPARARARKA